MNQNMTMEVAVFVPEGFDPNVLAELERIIPHIAGAISNEEPKMSESFSMILSPDGATAILPSKAAMSHIGDPNYEALLYDDLVFLRCCSENVLRIGGIDYLIGNAQIFNMDDDGNECSIDGEAVTDAMAFFDDCSTVIEVDGKTIPAIRLE